MKRLTAWWRMTRRVLESYFITVSPYIELPLRPGDKVVSMVQFRDEVIIATERGEVFRLSPE